MENKLKLPDAEGEWSFNYSISGLIPDVVNVTLTLKTGVNSYMEIYSVELGHTSVEELNEILEDMAQRLLLRSQMLAYLNDLSITTQAILDFKEV